MAKEKFNISFYPSSIIEIFSNKINVATVFSKKSLCSILLVVKNLKINTETD